MTNLYIDFDGVIVNTIEISYKMAEEQGLEKTYENYLQFFQTLNWEKVLNEASDISDGWNCIKKIIDSGKFYVSILTHVTSLHEAEEKIKMIRKHLDNITIIPVPKSISKTKMLNVTNAVLVDDYIHNLEEWEKAGGIGIKFDLDMDGKGFKVIDKLDTLITMFDK